MPTPTASNLTAADLRAHIRDLQAKISARQVRISAFKIRLVAAKALFDSLDDFAPDSAERRAVRHAMLEEIRAARACLAPGLP